MRMRSEVTSKIGGPARFTMRKLTCAGCKMVLPDDRVVCKYAPFSSSSHLFFFLLFPSWFILFSIIHLYRIAMPCITADIYISVFMYLELFCLSSELSDPINGIFFCIINVISLPVKPKGSTILIG